MSTLDENGLVIDRFPEVIDSIESTQRQDIEADFNYDDSNIIYQLNALFASREVEVLELIEAAYNAKVLSRATGVDLDYLGALKKTPRLQESRSKTSRQEFVGAAGTSIPANSVFRNPVTDDRFINTDIITLSPTEALRVRLSVLTVLNNTQYTVAVNGFNYNYTSDASATAIEIITGIQNLIQAATGASYSASISGNTLTIESDDSNPISVIVTTYIQVDEVLATGSLEALVPGRVVVQPNTVTQAVSTVPGLISTNNPFQYSLGRETETDPQYRQRIATSQGEAGYGTIPSIEAYLLANVEGIVDAKVIENATNAPDEDGRPAKSYETVVTGGTNEQIAEAIWITKGAGIELVGDVTETYTDERGTPRIIRFSRPTPINVAVRVRYTQYPEVVFPTNGQNLMIVAVVDFINGLTVDQDLITGRLYGPLYAASSNAIDELTVEIQAITVPGETPVEADWTTERLSIADDEFVTITNADVYVEETQP